MINLELQRKSIYDNEYASSSLAYFTVEYNVQDTFNKLIREDLNFIKSLGFFSAVLIFELPCSEINLKICSINIKNIIEYTNKIQLNIYIKLVINKGIKSNLKIDVLKPLDDLFTAYNHIMAVIIDDKYNINKSFKFNKIFINESKFIKDLNAKVLDGKVNFEELRENIFNSIFAGYEDIYIINLLIINAEYKYNNKDFFVNLKYLMNILSSFSESECNSRKCSRIDDIRYLYIQNKNASLLMVNAILPKTINIKNVCFSLEAKATIIMPLDVHFKLDIIDFAFVEVFKRVDLEHTEVWFSKTIKNISPVISINKKVYKLKINYNNEFKLKDKVLIIYCIPFNISYLYSIVFYENIVHLLLSNASVNGLMEGFYIDYIEKANLSILPRIKNNIFIFLRQLISNKNLMVLSTKDDIMKIPVKLDGKAKYHINIPDSIKEFDFYKDILENCNLKTTNDIYLYVYALDECIIKTELYSIKINKHESYYISLANDFYKRNILKYTLISNLKPIAYFVYENRIYIHSQLKNRIILY